MEYTIKRLADLAGVSTRTLRWYDQKGLLKPSGTSEGGYRLYGEASVARLQQIMFYKELDFSLSEISRILEKPEFDHQKALQSHLMELTKRREKMDALILTVSRTLDELQGGVSMSDQEKFEAFKTNEIKENESKYGKEIREAYGDTAVDESNAALGNMGQQEYHQRKETEETMLRLLKDAVLSGVSPAGPEGQEIAKLHWTWCFPGSEVYHPGKHRGIAKLYVMDERFTVYYDKETKGCARFLRDAVAAYAEGMESCNCVCQPV